MSLPMANLLKHLINPYPEDRLCYQSAHLKEIKRHAYFQSYEWEGEPVAISMPVSL